MALLQRPRGRRTRVQEREAGAAPNNLVSHDYRANEGAVHLRLIAYNTGILLQQEVEAAAVADRRPVTQMGIKARQARRYVLGGRLLREHDRGVLRLPASKKVATLVAFYNPNRVQG